MSNDIGTALLLMVVGMITVFVVLLMVVLSGQLLIRFVNRFRPETNKSQKTVVTRLSETPSFSTIVPNKLAAILAAVDIETQGKGRVQSIKKM